VYSTVVTQTIYSWTLQGKVSCKGMQNLTMAWPTLTSLMQVSPEGGALAAGEVANITVRFSPQEVEDCSRRLVATIPNLSSSLQAPNRAVTASVLRPWCHFDLPPSDYITAGGSPAATVCFTACAVMLCTKAALKSMPTVSEFCRAALSRHAQPWPRSRPS